MHSDIAYLKEQIEQECKAMQDGLNGFAITARHDFITKRLDIIGVYQKQLETLVGEQAATYILCETYAKVLERDLQ